jgi:hypothetical protein
MSIKPWNESPQAAALLYAEIGFSVFPCDARKKPLTPNGFKDATRKAKAIIAWWKRWPFAEVG